MLSFLISGHTSMVVMAAAWLALFLRHRRSWKEEALAAKDAATKKMTTKWGGNSAPLEAIVYPAADVWLKEHLGFECSICRLSSKRPLRTTRLAPVSSDPNDCCRYQDGAPLTILSMASVEGTHAREQCTGLAHAAATHQPSIDLLATLFASRSFH